MNMTIKVPILDRYFYHRKLQNICDTNTLGSIETIGLAKIETIRLAIKYS